MSEDSELTAQRNQIAQLKAKLALHEKFVAAFDVWDRAEEWATVEWEELAKARQALNEDI